MIIIGLNTRPSVRVDPKRIPHLGHLAIKDGKLYGDRKCCKCGDWFTFGPISGDLFTLIRKDLLPQHCNDRGAVRKLRGSGTGQCQDWDEIKKRHLEQKAWERFEELKSKGLVL